MFSIPFYIRPWSFRINFFLMISSPDKVVLGVDFLHISLYLGGGELRSVSSGS